MSAIANMLSGMPNDDGVPPMILSAFESKFIKQLTILRRINYTLTLAGVNAGSPNSFIRIRQAQLANLQEQHELLMRLLMKSSKDSNLKVPHGFCANKPSAEYCTVRYFVSSAKVYCWGQRVRIAKEIVSLNDRHIRNYLKVRLGRARKSRHMYHEVNSNTYSETAEELGSSCEDDSRASSEDSDDEVEEKGITGKVLDYAGKYRSLLEDVWEDEWSYKASLYDDRCQCGLQPGEVMALRYYQAYHLFDKRDSYATYLSNDNSYLNDGDEPV